MCSSSIISSLLWFSCQSGSPASQRVGAKCLVCTLVRHVFLAENFQVCSFPKYKAARSPSSAVGHCFCSSYLIKGWGTGAQNTSGRCEPTVSAMKPAGPLPVGWWMAGTGQLSGAFILRRCTHSPRSRVSATNSKFLTVHRAEATT